MQLALAEAAGNEQIKFEIELQQKLRELKEQGATAPQLAQIEADSRRAFALQQLATASARAEQQYQDELQLAQNKVTTGILNQTEARRAGSAAAQTYAATLRAEQRELERSNTLTEQQRDRLAEVTRTLRQLDADLRKDTLVGKIRAGIAAWGDLTQQVGDFTVNTLQSFTTTATDALMGLMDGTKSAGQAFAQFARGIIQQVIQMIVQFLILKAVTAALGFLGFAQGGPVGEPRKYADGGQITGPGGPTEDRVPILASAGEWVMRAAAVQKYGARFMAAINAGLLDVADLAVALPAVALPRPQYAYAGGGPVAPVGRVTSRGAASVTRPTIVVIGPREIDRIGADSRFRGSVRATIRDGRDVESALSRRKGHKL